MRALTVRQPWAWAIVHGSKDVENRTRNIAGSYRGPVAIHAGLAKFEQHNMASRALRDTHGTEVDTRVLYGAVIGVVDLIDVHHAPDDGDSLWCCGGTDEEGARPCSEWAMANHHHLILANPRALARPIPAKGHLGLWTPDDALAAAICEDLEVHP